MTFETSIDYLPILKLHYVLIPASVLDFLNEGEKKAKINHRVIISLNNLVEWQGGIVALGEGNGYVTLSSARMKKLNLKRYDSVIVRIQKDKSEFGHEMADELIEIFNQDPKAHERFMSLNPGMQRTILYYINQAKSSEKRAERGWFYMKNLCSIPPGSETMRKVLGKD